MRFVSLAAAAGLLLATTTVGFAQNPNSGAGDPETRKNESMPGQSGAAPGQQMQQKGMQQQQQPGTTGQAPNRQNTPAQNPGGGGGAGAGNPQDPLTTPRR
jgi:hypothetical protein